MHTSSQIAIELLSSLKSISYACAVLTPLPDGYVNYVYLGKLVSALPITPPTTQIIVKHAEPFIAANSAWKSPVTRIRYEALML
ncbi:kinase-like domain-containing protein [Penicillium longicatenatum]|uniref:kinase-like domain-containing protein n=1 Tax=Penicillium longicatenatum TaxID=1561947 RepID=UPI00254963C0|nr:kinase-like domain-containing protein [Penicillium longicatenatum]KAJ5644242.1 kinase-like domain-containing protein [Penicillium longicatenatum]